MSTKHLRRYLQEKKTAGKKSPFREEDEKEGKEESSESAVEEERSEEAFVCNRFEFLEESGEGADESSGPIEETSVEKRMEKKEKKLIKKKKKGKKKAHCTDTDNDIDKLVAPTPKIEIPKLYDMVFERDLFKVDSRMLNVECELRSILGRRSTDTVQRGRMVFGKIVKKKENWPEIKNVGLSMELDRTEGDILWFRFSHHAYYRELQQSFWIASETLNHNFISNILAQCPYHLDSLLIMAELLRQQEDYQLSRDLIERGLFCCESIFAPRFQLSNFDHRIDYVDFENRAFYLLLHRHLRNLVDRHCFKTALHVAKLIYRLDPVSDPLAIMLTIDTIALKAREYKYLILLYNTLQAPKNLDRLPNFAYSVALAHFLLFCENGKTEDKEIADTMIASALRHFPTVLLKLLDAMNVQPDSAVENNEYMSALAHEREHSYTFMAGRNHIGHCVIIHGFQRRARRMGEAKDAEPCRRKKCYVGIPRNIERHAYLWEVARNADWILSDPAPPYNGRMMYRRIPSAPRPDSFLSGLLHSVWPEYDQAQHLNASIEEVLNVLRGLFMNETHVADNREAANEMADEAIESREMGQEHEPRDEVDDDDAEASSA